VSPDGGVVAVTTGNGAALAFDAASGGHHGTSSWQSDVAKPGEFSRDGERFVAAAMGVSAQVLIEVATWTESARVVLPDQMRIRRSGFVGNSVFGLPYSRGLFVDGVRSQVERYTDSGGHGRDRVLVGESGALWTWDGSDPVLVPQRTGVGTADRLGERILSGHGNTVRWDEITVDTPATTLDVALSEGHVAAGLLDHSVMVWNLDGTLVGILEGHEGRVVSVAWHEGRLLTGSWDGSARWWTLRDDVSAGAAEARWGIRLADVLDE